MREIGNFGLEITVLVHSGPDWFNGFSQISQNIMKCYYIQDFFHIE